MCLIYIDIIRGSLANVIIVKMKVLHGLVLSLLLSVILSLSKSEAAPKG